MSRIRAVLAFIAELAKKPFTTNARFRSFDAPRMCPFCGLITSRSKPLCLECGKSLREVHP